MNLPSFKNTVLEQSQDVFKESFSYNDLVTAGMRFKSIADKGKGKFIIAKAGDDVISIPCGKSITDDHDTPDCEFGLTDDGTLVAYVSQTAWL